MAKSDAVNKYNNSGNLQIVSFILSITLALTELRRIPHQRKTTRRFRFFLRVWRRSGGALYYRSGNKMIVVSVTTSPGFRASAPKELWEGNYSGAPCGIARSQFIQTMMSHWMDSAFSWFATMTASRPNVLSLTQLGGRT